MSRLALFDSLISPAKRSTLRQGLTRWARGLDPINPSYRNFDAPIVLAGAARGGTTLLANLVGAHPRITIFHERFTIGKDSYQDTFGSTVGTADLRQAFIRYLPHDLKQQNRRWGVKICTYHWQRADYDRFLRAFPRAQFVFVLRDGRDVLLSMLKRSKIFRTPEQCATRWLESVEVYDALCQKLGGRMLSFHYETLTANPEAEVRTICEFLGEPFRPEMLDPQTWPRVGSYEIAPVTADRVGKWKEQGLPELPAELETRFKTTLRRLGYTE
ncbi:MAG: sulfotransferase [Anaerolineae bacterium]